MSYAKITAQPSLPLEPSPEIRKALASLLASYEVERRLGQNEARYQLIKPSGMSHGRGMDLRVSHEGPDPSVYLDKFFPDINLSSHRSRKYWSAAFFYLTMSDLARQYKLPVGTPIYVLSEPRVYDSFYAKLVPFQFELASGKAPAPQGYERYEGRLALLNFSDEIKRILGTNLF